MTSTRSVFLALLVLAACDRSPAKSIEGVPGGTQPDVRSLAEPGEAEPVPTAGVEAPAADAADADPLPASATTIVREAIALEPGGPELALGGEDETVIDAGSTFRVALVATSADARLTLLDGRDALVPARGTREVGAATVLTVEPTEPLVPAGRYTLRLEGASTRELHDAEGRPYAPLAFPLLVAGEAPPPEPRPAPKKKPRQR